MRSMFVAVGVGFGERSGLALVVVSASGGAGVVWVPVVGRGWAGWCSGRIADLRVEVAKPAVERVTDFPRSGMRSSKRCGCVLVNNPFDSATVLVTGVAPRRAWRLLRIAKLIGDAARRPSRRSWVPPPTAAKRENPGPLHAYASRVNHPATSANIVIVPGSSPQYMIIGCCRGSAILCSSRSGTTSSRSYTKSL